MRQLARATHARPEGLAAIVVAVAAVGFEEMVTALAERQDALLTVQPDELDEPFAAQMTQVRFARVGFITRLTEIALGHDPKRPNGRERAAVVAVQFVAVIAVEHDLALGPAWQFKAFDKHVTWLAVSVGPIALSLARIVISVTRVVRVAIRLKALVDFDPLHLDIANIDVAIT